MSRVILTDGGMGQELIRRSGEPPDPLWSAKVMIERPDLVLETHRDFIAAGARVITVNSYSATRPRLEREGRVDRLDGLHRTACELALKAREGAAHAVAVAGCLPPLVGSYVPEVVPPFEDSLALYREICALQAPHVDLFLCETMSTAAEACAAATAAAGWGKPVWVSWTLADDPADGRLRSGETLAEAATALDGLGVAVRLVNCCRPETVDAALAQLAAIGGSCWGAYANGFDGIDELRPGGTVDALSIREDLGPRRHARFALGWVDAGATVVGGCCEVGPEHIAALARALVAAGHTLADAGDLLGVRDAV